MTKMSKLKKFTDYQRRKLLGTGRNRKGRPPVLGELRDLYALGFEVKGERLIDSRKKIPDFRERAIMQYILLPKHVRNLYSGHEEFYEVKKLAVRLSRQAARKSLRGFTMEECMEEAYRQVKAEKPVPSL